jgi:hypothetical protein
LENKIIIIPEGCIIDMHVWGLLAQKYNIKSICLQWGFFGQTATKAGWRDMPYHKFLVWGVFFEKQFRKYSTICKLRRIK